MRIFIPSESKQTLGGGWTFIGNFQKGVDRYDRTHKVIPVQGLPDRPMHYDDDIFFIAGATIVQRETVIAAKNQGMKIVLRVDNAPRNSNNRNTGTSRLYDFAQLADLVIYQSDWAREYLSPFTKKDGPVILNGADTDIFNEYGPKQPTEGAPQFAYIRYNRDETKNFHVAWYDYIMEQRKHKDAHLWLIGRFSDDHRNYNFDFFMGEKYRYVGVLENAKDMAEYMRSIDTLLIPYFNDACSNTLIEARLCGIKDIRYIPGSGGNDQIMSAPIEELDCEYMAMHYIHEFKKL